LEQTIAEDCLKEGSSSSIASKSYALHTNSITSHYNNHVIPYLQSKTLMTIQTVSICSFYFTISSKLYYSKKRQ